MAESLEIPRILDEHIQVKERERGYPESEHILALAANAFIGGDFIDDLEALREDTVIQRAIGRKDIPDPTTAADFCRRLPWVIFCSSIGPWRKSMGAFIVFGRR